MRISDFGFKKKVGKGQLAKEFVDKRVRITSGEHTSFGCGLRLADCGLPSVSSLRSVADCGFKKKFGKGQLAKEFVDKRVRITSGEHTSFGCGLPSVSSLRSVADFGFKKKVGKGQLAKEFVDKRLRITSGEHTSFGCGLPSVSSLRSVADYLR